MNQSHRSSPEKIKSILASHCPAVNNDKNGYTPASVLAPFYPAPEGLSLIFTKRTELLDHHKGQISFPGGRQEPRDRTSLATALRETHEEIGVRPEDVEVWGRLNQETTITNFTVAPYVGLIPYPYEFELNPQEVERLIIVPLDHLMDPANFSTQTYPWEGRDYEIYRFTYHQDVIWGATARMVFNLITLIETGSEAGNSPFLEPETPLPERG